MNATGDPLALPDSHERDADRPATIGFAAALLRGEFRAELLFPYPRDEDDPSPCEKEAAIAERIRVAAVREPMEDASPGSNDRRKSRAELVAATYALVATARETAALRVRGVPDHSLEVGILESLTRDLLCREAEELPSVRGEQREEPNRLLHREIEESRFISREDSVYVGLRPLVAESLREISPGLRATLEGLRHLRSFLPALWSFTVERMKHVVRPPVVPTTSHQVRPHAMALARRISRFAAAIERTLIRHPEAQVIPSAHLDRIIDALIAAYTASCTLARWDAQLAASVDRPGELAAAELYLKLALDRLDAALSAMITGRDRRDAGGARRP